jgi:hypothetical protein
MKSVMPASRLIVAGPRSIRFLHLPRSRISVSINSIALQRLSAVEAALSPMHAHDIHSAQRFDAPTPKAHTSTMHVQLLLDHLKKICGHPIRIPNQDAYQWVIEPRHGGSPVHVCLTLERDTSRASIWLFHPNNPSLTQTEYLFVKNEQELGHAIARLDALCQNIAL